VTGDESEPGTLGLTRALAASSPFFEIEPTAPDDPAFLYFTSGTTGAPKGALHVHEAVLAQHATAKYALDLHPDDIFWCSADPDCVTGMSYGVIAPLTHGVTLLSDEGEFDARRRYSVLADQRVTVWYATPAALRTLTRHGSEPPAGFDLSALRFVASGGEPLAPEAVVWGQDVLGLPVHDNWSQTETGAIMIGNFAAEPIRPGAMGRPLPGVEARLLTRDEDGEWHEPAGADQAGELALRRGWPSMFRGYWRAPARYDESFSDGWYLSGDIARRDEDGYYWFIGRTDDVIVSAGILIGPFEVENALMGHPAVAEAGVIGKPDAAAGELVKAFVTLDDGYRPTDALRRVLLDFGRRVLGAAAPREIEFDRQLPHTRSGKVLRRLLKARELGLPEGDLSTVECAS
jgi:acetyl-CoA synthetase